jgi:hypothetical protein
MKRDFKNEKHWNEWLAQRFDGKETVSVVVDLLPCRNHQGEQQWLTQDIIDQTARRFRNKLNQHYFCHAARRFGKGLDITIHRHDEPHRHFHIVIEKPEAEIIIKFRSVIETICLEDGWLKPCPYFGMTKSESAAQAYNSRHGADTLILF